MTDRMHINWDIIVRRITGKSTAVEDNLVEKWLEEDEQNREYYRKAKRYFDVYYTGEETREVDTESAWGEFVDYAGTSSRKKVWRKIMGYAAAAVILLGAGIACWSVNERQERPGVMIANERIESGVMKALLILNSGIQVELTDSSVLERVVEEYRLKVEGGEERGDTVQYNTVIVPRGGEYNLVLADGTSVKINSDSELSFPDRFTGEERQVRLTGEALFNVTKDTEHPFIVETKDGCVRVLGTEFNVNAYRDEEFVKTTLVNGKVAFRGTGMADSVVLVPGEQVAYNRNTGETLVVKVDTRVYTAWAEGKWIIEGQRLEDIMKQLSRWYDVTVFYQNPESKDLIFTGDLEKYNDCDVVLDIISMTTDVTFELKGRVVTVKM